MLQAAQHEGSCQTSSTAWLAGSFRHCGQARRIGWLGSQARQRVMDPRLALGQQHRALERIGFQGAGI
jgi:hypothetical protein